MKGNTQLPQLPLLVVFETGDGDGVVDGDGVEPDVVVLVTVTPVDS